MTDETPEEIQGELLFAFENQTKDYAMGFEAGKIYQKLLEGYTPLDEWCHKCNETMITIVAIRNGYKVISRLEVEDKEWIHFLLEKKDG